MHILVYSVRLFLLLLLRFTHDEVVLQAFDKLRLRRWNFQQWKGKSSHVIAVLEIGVKVFQTANFGVQHQRLGLAVERKVPAVSGAVEVRFLHAFDLHLADGAADPLGGIRFGCLQENLGGGLRQHDLGKVAVDDFQLRFALETENDWVARLAVLGNGRMKLRQLLQTGQFVEHKPYRTLLGRRRAEQAENEHVDPEAM